MKIIPNEFVGSSLVEGFLRRVPENLTFYPAGHPADLESYVRRASAVDVSFSEEQRLRIVAGLRGGGTDGLARRKRFVEEGGYVVTTGQQPGLFGGPLFSIYKALTAAALADRLEARLEKPVLPVFWVAGEDHDWEEVRRITVADLSNALQEVEVPIPEGADGRPLHRVKVGPALEEARQALMACLPPSEFLPDLEDRLVQSYGPAATLAQGFARWMEELLAPAGIMILEPEQTPWVEARLPLLLEIARKAVELDHEGRGRAEALEKAGFHRQVPHRVHGVPLFAEVEGKRERLMVEKEDSGRTYLHTRHGDVRWTVEELEAWVAEDPALLSPNVLSRPVIEAALLPTLAYVAGPAEMAYLAQTAPIFEALQVAPPVVHPRLSATVVERKVERVLEKFERSIEDLAAPYEQLVSSILRTDLPAPLQDALTGVRTALDEPIAVLRAAVQGVDPTLHGPVDGLLNQFLHGIDDVERKIVQARKRQTETTLRQLEKAQIQIFPGGKPQERVFPALSYLARYGDEVMHMWGQAAQNAVLLR